MQRGWLLALMLIVLALFAAPVRAEKVKPEAAEHPTKQEGSSGVIPPEEEQVNIFKGFLDLSIWTVVVFLILLYVLSKFAWKPMLQGLEQREHAIRSAMEEAKAAKEEAAKLRAELQAELTKARSEAQAVRDEARRDAERLRDEIAAKAKADMQAERERLRKDMENARDQVLNELWAQTAQLSTMVAAKAVKRQITIDDQNRLVDEALAELRGAAAERQQVMASIQ
jgi:F-type H+-transporting ATPase subunit b